MELNEIEKQILESFDYHKPNDDQTNRIQNIRDAHKLLAFTIFKNVKNSADRTVALRKLHECMMNCNKSIVLEK